LYKIIPESILPLDYGGEELSADILAGKISSTFQKYVVINNFNNFKIKTQH